MGPSLLCSVGACFCALPIEHVVETMRPLPLEPLRGAPDLVRGVAVVRGDVVPVVDAARLLGAVATRPGRFVLLRVGERRLALAVDRVLGVQQLSASSLHELPLLLGTGPAEIVSEIGTLDTQLLFVLRAMRLVPESVWRSLDAAKAS